MCKYTYKYIYKHRLIFATKLHRFESHIDAILRNTRSISHDPKTRSSTHGSTEFRGGIWYVLPRNEVEFSYALLVEYLKDLTHLDQINVHFCLYCCTVHFVQSLYQINKCTYIKFHIKTFKIAQTCFDPKIILKELRFSLLKSL